ncbi:MAG: STAS-like domain-containing protein [Proteobacteria bacterium]|nr:STAS-like domain-containing protein [Pseudomonadota bacterium]
MTKVLNVASDFSRSPSGRYVSDGPYSGERFREELLFPALQADHVEVVLDGVLTLGSSFLEEAFGGLVREHGLNPKELRGRLKIRSRLHTYVQKAWTYMESARPRVV